VIAVDKEVLKVDTFVPQEIRRLRLSRVLFEDYLSKGLDKVRCELENDIIVLKYIGLENKRIRRISKDMLAKVDEIVSKYGQKKKAVNRSYVIARALILGFGLDTPKITCES